MVKKTGFRQKRNNNISVVDKKRKLKGVLIMRFLVKKAPDNFIKTVNDEISSILNRHFDNFYPEYGYEEDIEKLSMPVEVTEKEKETNSNVLK